MSDQRLIVETEMSGRLIFESPNEVLGFTTPRPALSYTLDPDGSTTQVYFIEIYVPEECLQLCGDFDTLSIIFKNLKTYTN
jgi:hypothetical protein